MQMIEQEPKPLWSGWVKLLGLAVAGGVVGYFIGHSVSEWSKPEGVLANLRYGELALFVAMFYLLMGTMVGVGAASPKVGSKILNVEDADEIREQSILLRMSALGCIALGLALAAVALGGEGGIIKPLVAGGFAVFASAIFIITSVSTLRHSDEFGRVIMREAGSTAYNILFVGLGAWTVMSHLGVVRAPASIEVLALLCAGPLVASFWVVGKRGMLKPRS